MNEPGAIKNRPQPTIYRWLLTLCLSLLLVGHQIHPFSATAQPPIPPRQVNAPYFDGQVLYPEMAILWFGQVNSTDNYADLRVGYNDVHLQISINAFDRYLWYDTAPGPDLNEWDSVTLYLDLNDDDGSAPESDDYRFGTQLNWWEPRDGYQTAYQGDDSGWAAATIPFTTTTGWRGESLNNNQDDDRGWVANLFIPFSSLGLSGPPPQGTI